MAGEKQRAGLADESKEGAAQQPEGLGDFGLAVPGPVFAPLGVAFPVVLVLDAPVLANEVGELPGTDA
jgi:hypothetical protein